MNTSHAKCCARLASLLVAATTHAATHYVSLDGSHVAPFDTWAKAATNIQDAVDIAVAGDTVLVTNGVYDSGERCTPGYASLNRVVITNAITVRSVNGPEGTVIAGAGPLGASGVRCLYAAAGVISGFCLSNGHTRTDGNNDYEKSGGGANMNAGTAVLTNCVVIGCRAAYSGGGVCYGRVARSRIIANSSALHGGGLFNCHADNCIVAHNTAAGYGGGSDNYNNTFIVNCCVMSNNNALYGGAIDGGKICNSLIRGNVAQYGGAAYYSDVINCTVYGNNASSSGGGLYAGIAWNSIVWNNTAYNYGSSPSFFFTCTTPSPGGMGNIGDDPRFVDGAAGDFHIAYDSPCRDAATNVHVVGQWDLDGNPRVVGGLVDMGCYEFIPEPGVGVLPGLIAVCTLQSAVWRRKEEQ